MIRRAVEPGWATAYDVGPGLRLLEYADGSWRFEHPYKDLGGGDQLVCAPLLQTDTGGHQVAGLGLAVSVNPSISCPDCGTHGHVTEGRWVPC